MLADTGFLPFNTVAGKTTEEIKGYAIKAYGMYTRTIIYKIDNGKGEATEERSTNLVIISIVESTQSM